MNRPSMESPRSFPEPAEGSLRLRTSTGDVPLGFAREGGMVFLIARDRASRWPVEIMRNGVADLELPHETVRGIPRLLSDPHEQERVLSLFREKYGPDRFVEWYEHPARVLEVSIDSSLTHSGPGGDQYYRWLEAEFDNVAGDYDHHITGNRINRLLRDRSLAWLIPRFRRAPRLLEIGCGSGMETLPLLRLGHEILAVDISERMLTTVREKAAREGLSKRLETRQVRARDLNRLREDYTAASFDGAYSTYGALNCEPDLGQIPLALHGLLKPGAAFVAGVYNRWCLFEIAGYGASLQMGRALGRRKNPVPVGSSRFCVDVYAHSVADFRRLFRRRFSVERIEGVPAILPPSDLTAYAEKFSRHFEQLARWDAHLGIVWPFNALGDHFLMTFVRTA